MVIPQQPLILQLSNMPDAKTFITNLFTSKTLTCRKVIIFRFLYTFMTKLTGNSVFRLVMCMNHCPTTILGAIKVSKYLSDMWFSHSLNFPFFFVFDKISTFTPGLINLSISRLSSYFRTPHHASLLFIRNQFFFKSAPPPHSPKFAQISSDFPRNLATWNLATRNLAT